MNQFITYLFASAALCLFACQTHDHDHDHDHAHDHAQTETVQWWGFTELHEVFVEAEVPLGLEKAQMAIHLTSLEGFKPANEVSLRMEFVKDSGSSEWSKATPASPGIWEVLWSPPASGNVEVKLWWASPVADGHVSLGRLSTEDGHGHSAEWKHAAEGVHFNREQVWAMPFKTTTVQLDTVWSTLKVAGKWMVAPGDDQIVSAGANGIVWWGDRMPISGSSVRIGEVIARIDVGEQAGHGLAAEAAEAEAEWVAADAALKRLKPLLEAGALTATEWEEAVARHSIAEEAWERLRVLRSNEMWLVRAPMDGFVRSILAQPGGYVQADAALCVITSDREQWIELQLNPQYREALENAKRIRVETSSGWIDGKLVSSATQVDQGSGLLRAYVSLNAVVPGSRPIAGSFAQVEIDMGSGRPAWALPTSALLEQYGQFEVAVQTGGEQFEMRPIQVGSFNSVQAEVISGLEASERVVTEGAYAIRMASLKGSTPAHGHTH